MKGSDPLLERLGRAAEAATGDDERAATFARGLVLGALVGAAVAGSTLWQRRRARGEGVPHGPGVAGSASPTETATGRATKS